ncbi:MmgE/PrpD family protein [Geodermatophilus sp. DF01-2]|uniref:MmgE/PrpD family protein n=1 Tax=Geodermatophilus sp. DF01-2 TaxID=2559610 RepID=UPI00107460A6|nr:MmgE/PrpD family protein [Geodermatophilus sp. DF01_2]TFV61911.1 MmgE/PrpD family protein [Geodermatophilus sp. DF01_2]
MTALTEPEVVAGDLTLRLATFVSGIDAGDLPEPAVERLQQCLLDFVGLTAFAGARSESSDAIRGGVTSLATADGPGTVVGDDRGYPFPYAALLNGAFAHSLDFDDTNIYGSLHPGAPVIPAALAVAERTGATGSQLMEALAAGYETCCRVGAALGQTGYDRGFHITPVAGIFGAIAAGARLLGFSPDRLAAAWGLGGSMASGSMQYLANGAWNKRLHPGLASHDALLCLSFAESGVVAAAQPFEGRFGLLAGYSNAPAPELLVRELGERWVLTETAIKPYPSCRFTHGAVDVALEVRERLGGPPTSAGRLGLRISPRAYQIVGGTEPNKTAPANVVDAQFSVYFQTAVALLDGAVEWASYDRLPDPDVRDLAGRLELVADEAVPTAGAVLTYAPSSGQAVTVSTDRPIGEPGDDLPWTVVEKKFHDLAGAVFAAEHRDRIVAQVRALRALDSAADWIRTLRRPSAAGGPS